MIEVARGFRGNPTCSIRVRRRPSGGLEVQIGGELDSHSASTLEVVLEECVPERRPIALDLSGVTFIDRCALDVITHLCRRATTAVTIEAASACVERLIELVDHGELHPHRRVV